MISDPRKTFTFKALANGEVEIILYDEIDPVYGISAKTFNDELKKVGNVNTIHVRINSPGGSVPDGYAIYNRLKEHPARVVVHVDGMAMSIASIIAMAGDEILMAQNSFMMIHTPWNIVAGDASDFEHMAEILYKLEIQLVNVYAKRTKQSPEKIAQLMDEETWLFPEDAVSLGFADRITDGLAVAAVFDPSRFSHVPEKLKNNLLNFQKGNETMANILPNDTDNKGSKTTTTPADQAVKDPAQIADLAKADNKTTNDYSFSKGIADFRAQQAAETERIARIREICNGQHADIEVKAIGENWTGEKAELECLRASRPSGPAIHAGGTAVNDKTLQAGLLLSVRHPEKALEKAFGPQILEAAERFRNISFKELANLCCALEGCQPLGLGASNTDYIRAGFSTISLPGILSNVAHKVMMEAYTAVPAIAARLCKPLTATDFKTHTGYRLTSDLKFEEVGADGEIKHGKVGESSFTYSIKTYAKMFGYTRQMQINDDLGAFAEPPRLIGRGCALMEERLFWELVHANTGNFFHANNKNLITKVLGSAGMKLAVQALEEQQDTNKDPILIMGRYLVTPPALHETADEIYQSPTINTGGAATTEKVPNKNIYVGRYESLSSPYISSTAFHASATPTQWFLWGDPADVAAFGFASLNGQSAPIVEEVPLSGEYLGRAWRGYRDVGVCQIDAAGAVKSTGVTG